MRSLGSDTTKSSTALTQSAHPLQQVIERARAAVLTSLHARPASVDLPNEPAMVPAAHRACQQIQQQAQKIYQSCHIEAAVHRPSLSETATDQPVPHRSHEKGRQEKKAALPPYFDFQAALRASYAPVQVQVQTRLHQVASQPPLLADLLDLEALRPKRGRGAGTEGAGALARLLDELVRYLLTVRPYQGHGVPRQAILHLSAEMVAAALECNEATAWRWTQKLEELGYLQARPHYTTMTTRDGERVTAIDGTLYAVRLEVGHRAHLGYADLTRQYRNLDDDRRAGQTAHRAILQARKLAENVKSKNAVPDAENKMQGSTKFSISSKYLREQLKAWAVTPGQVSHPLTTDPCILTLEELGEAVQTVQDVVYLLPTVAEVHQTKRAALVGTLGAALARALNDQHSRAWYCRIIWRAWATETEGLMGLQVLAAQLSRLDIDRREWRDLRRPAALLNARLNVA